MILYILQNGYHSEKYQYRNLEEWYCDLKKSYSGKRLMEMIPEGFDVEVINSTPEIGINADSCLPCDLDYVRQKIAKFSPDIICACGKVAQSACEKLGVEFIPAPHPAWRQLSKKETQRIRREIMFCVQNNTESVLSET